MVQPGHNVPCSRHPTFFPGPFSGVGDIDNTFPKHFMPPVEALLARCGVPEPFIHLLLPDARIISSPHQEGQEETSMVRATPIWACSLLALGKLALPLMPVTAVREMGLNLTGELSLPQFGRSGPALPMGVGELALMA